MTVTGSLALDQLTEAELVECLGAGTVGHEAFAAEVARREQADQARRARSDRARTAARARNAEWEAAAYAQYLAAEAYCAGNMLSPAGKRAGRDAWPMCWQGSDETARGLASDELITFWDYVSPRVPGPGQYAASKREAAAEHAARAAEPTAAPTAPPMSEAQKSRYVAALAAYGSRAASPAPAPQPGCIARYTRRLEALTDQLTRQAARLAQISGGNQR